MSVQPNAYAAKGAGKLYGLVPSRTLDNELGETDFVPSVASRLEVDVMEGGLAVRCLRSTAQYVLDSLRFLRSCG